jgi:hypothetical protein
MSLLLRRIVAPYLMAPEEDKGGGSGAAPAPAPAPAAALNEDPDADGKALVGAESRVEKMRRISQANMERTIKEHAENGMTIEPIEEPEAPAATPAPAPAQRATRASNPPPAPPAPTPQAPAADQITLQMNEPIDIERLDNLTVRVKIDGKVVERKMADARRDIQMDGAAQHRLEVATRLMDQANDMAKRAAQAPAPNAEPAAPPVGSDAPSKEKDSAAVADLATRLTKALFEGDEGKTKELMTEALQTLKAEPAKSIDETALRTEVTRTVKQQLSNEEAEAKFTADFKDIVADPYLAAIADAELVRVQKEKPELSYHAQLEEAGKGTRAWMSARGLKPATEPAPPAPPAAPANRERKLTERKQEIDNVSGTSSRAQSPAAVEPASTSDVIAKMRQGRAVSGARV